MKKPFLEAGKIVGTHGLKGEVRIDPWCDSADFLCRFKRLFFDGGKEVRVLSARVHKNIAIVLLDGIKTVEQAEALRSSIVYISRDDVRLPEGVWFVQDILGLRAVDADDGREYGIVTDVLQTGANDVYQVTKDGHDYLIPKIPDVVREIDPDSGVIRISTRILKGLFDDEN